MGQQWLRTAWRRNDNEPHNVYFLDDRTGETLDIGTWAGGVSVDHTFTQAGTIITLCKLHLEMAAYIIVVDTPWFTTARFDPDTLTAEFDIDGVPAGEYELRVWHKKLAQKGGTKTIRVQSGATTNTLLTVTKPQYAGSTG